MKRYLIVLGFTALVFVGCNNGQKADYAATESIADTAYNGNLQEKIVKTADMQFRVKDVQRAKEDIGKAVKQQGGVVVEASISSQIENTEKVKYSLDSLKEITAYRKQGLIVAKVPAEKLDEFTNQMSAMAVFVDNQSLKMDDRSLSYLANKLKVGNRQEAISQIKKTASKTGTNVESSLYIKDDYIDKKIDNLNIDNMVKYSTITLSFYQDNTVKTLIVPNDNLYDYRPGFFNRLWLNIVDGWAYFKEFVLFLSKLWLFYVVGAVVYFVIRYYTKKRKSKMILPPPNN